MPQLNIDNCIDIIQDINNVMNDHTTTFFPSSASMKASYNAFEVFTDGRSLFMSDPLYNVPEFLIPSSVEYGILPLPKYTEEQDAYYSQTHPTHSTVIAVPKVNPDLNKTGKIIEDFTYMSTLTVYPVIMDTMIKHQSAQSEADYEMLGIIFEGIRCDLGLAMSNEMKIDYDVRVLIRENSTAISSTLKGNAPTYQGIMDKIVSAWISE